MDCPECGKGTRIRDSRMRKKLLWRRRECLVCGHRQTTYEMSRTSLEQMEKPKEPTGKVKAKESYTAYIQYAGRLMKVGTFNTPEEAEQAEKRAIKAL